MDRYGHMFKAASQKDAMDAIASAFAAPAAPKSAEPNGT